MTTATRILVVDDSSVARSLVVQVLTGEPGLVVETAADGQLALEQIDRQPPDLVLLDVEMPVLDGISTLRAIRRQHPRLPVVMFSALTQRGAAITIEALVAGADDYLPKPRGMEGLAAMRDQLRSDLLQRVRSLCGRNRQPGKPRPTPTAAVLPAGRIDVLAIASSTGGPNALAELLPALPRDLPVPVVVVQHMPATFTTMLAKSLDAKCDLEVAEGQDGGAVVPGRVWIAPGGQHMVVRRDGDRHVLGLNQEPPENSCRPAADVLFRSVAQTYGSRVLAVVLTGMGSDGCAGSAQIRRAGGAVLAQDEATSVVWGMPGAVARAGLADAVLPLTELAPAIVARLAAGPVGCLRPAATEVRR
ncbi:MAG: chemotaxis response regulator protein-glutamate methylesterase [Planctomycetes bacterium]|nr:chemotaxis response regulator protein-glutamate methylesterase [Planctomycetota bacterium]